MRKVLPRLGTPVHRHSPIFAREGGDFAPSAPARWVSNVDGIAGDPGPGAVAHCAPEGAPPFGDETPVKLLVPRTGAHAVRRFLVLHGTRARHGGQEAARPGSGEGEKTR